MAIQTYVAGSQEYENLMQVAGFIKAIVPHMDFKVGDTWFDYGAGMRWTTIICYRDSEHRDSYQMLYPRQQEDIINATDDGTLRDIAKTIVESQCDLLHLN